MTLLDAAEVGQALAALPNGVEAALTDYEQVLFLRSAEYAAAAAYSPTTQEIVDFFTHDERTA